MLCVAGARATILVVRDVHTPDSIDGVANAKVYVLPTCLAVCLSLSIYLGAPADDELLPQREVFLPPGSLYGGLED